MSNHIVEILKKEIENFKTETKVEKVGNVLEVFDGIAKISGLSDIKSSEMVTFQNGEMGVVLNLEEDAVGVIILGDFSKIKPRIWPHDSFDYSRTRGGGACRSDSFYQRWKVD